MCGRKRERRSQIEDSSSYTGATISLNAESRTTAGPSCSRKYHFPFWLLWLIWPLAGLLKVVIPSLATALAIAAQWTLPLWPLLLIAIGLFLLRRR